MTASPDDPLVVHLVSHTHWDREWYKTASAFRVHLLPLVARVLDERLPFLLDGQAVILADVLEWAPAWRAPISRALADGWLEAGPWFVLADNAIAGGEALVRNLALGRDLLAALGGTPPLVLYCPDTFGHPEVGPTLGQGFGLSMAVVWRGYGGRGWPAGDSARWRSRSGDELLLHHLPAPGYEYGSALPVDPAVLAARWNALRELLAPRSTSGQLLLLNGADHHAPQADRASIAATLADVVAPHEVRQQGLAGFADAQRGWAANRALPAVAGELRGSPAFVWTLGGTTGTRAHQKRENARLERLLAQELEPWCALAPAEGHEVRLATLAALWRTLLLNHPHDTLCGCSVDAVARAMDQRHLEVRTAAEELRATTLAQLAGQTDAADPLAIPPLLLTNPLPHRRSGVVEATVDLPVAPVPIGFGSAGRDSTPRLVPRWSVRHRGRMLPMQRLATEQAVARDEAPERYPRTRLVQRHHLLAWVDDILPQGVETLDVGPAARRAAPPRVVTARGHTMDNGLLRVWWDATAGLSCEGEHGGWRDLLALETVGERGDLYTHSPIPGSGREGRWRSARLTLKGPLRAELTLVGTFEIAARRVTDATGQGTMHRASTATVRVRVQLDAGTPWVRLVVDGVSKAHDYRLRLRVHAGLAGTMHRADAAFAPVDRRSRPVPPEPGDVEQLPATWPLHRWVGGSCDDPARGMTVLSDGLGEYEITTDGAVAVTLVRAVGELTRPDLPERPGHAGYPAATPLAQSTGPFAALLGVLPHGGRHAMTHAAVESAAAAFLLPASACPVPRALPVARAGPELSGVGVRWLGTRPGPEGSVLVRCANVTSERQQLSLCWHGLTAAARCRLDDTPLGALPVRDDRVDLELAPYAVATVALRR